jgi:hypothetical protein
VTTIEFYIYLERHKYTHNASTESYTHMHGLFYNDKVLRDKRKVLLERNICWHNVIALRDTSPRTGSASFLVLVRSTSSDLDNWPVELSFDVNY